MVKHIVVVLHYLFLEHHFVYAFYLFAVKTLVKIAFIDVQTAIKLFHNLIDFNSLF